MDHVQFIEQLSTVARICHEASAGNGFWETDHGVETDVMKSMLIVTELAEMVEGLRHGNPPSDHIPAFTAAEEEMADTLIRMMDLWHKRGWRVPEAVLTKISFNYSRSHKHGKEC